MQQEMEYILRIYQEKSFSKAAEKLFLTQPALSMAVRKVEDQLGMPIFDRSARPLALTEAGQIYMDYIRQTMDLEQQTMQRMQDIRSLNTGALRLGGSHYLTAYILPKLLTGFSAQYPNIRIDLVESSSSMLSEMLARKELDLTFHCNEKFVAEYPHFPAFRDHILLAVPDGWSINRELADLSLSAEDVLSGKHLSPDCPVVPLSRFQNLEFILLSPGNNLHERSAQLFLEAGFTPRVKLQLSQLVTAYHLSAAALGATFVSDRLVRPQDTELRFYALDSAHTTRDFYMLLPIRHYTSLAVRAFIDYFGAYFS